MLKLLGALMVIFACAAFALQSISRQRSSRRAVAELEKLLVELARSISFRLEPLPELIGRLAQEDSPPAAGFLKRLETALADGEHRPLGELWAEAVTAFSKEKQLPARAAQIMEAVGARLGQMDFESETARLSEAAAELKSLQAELESESGKKEKTVKTLGILLGIFIVIILI